MMGFEGFQRSAVSLGDTSESAMRRKEQEILRKLAAFKSHNSGLKSPMATATAAETASENTHFNGQDSPINSGSERIFGSAAGGASQTNPLIGGSVAASTPFSKSNPASSNRGAASPVQIQDSGLVDPLQALAPLLGKALNQTLASPDDPKGVLILVSGILIGAGLHNGSVKYDEVIKSLLPNGLPVNAFSEGLPPNTTLTAARSLKKNTTDGDSNLRRDAKSSEADTNTSEWGVVQNANSSTGNSRGSARPSASDFFDEDDVKEDPNPFNQPYSEKKRNSRIVGNEATSEHGWDDPFDNSPFAKRRRVPDDGADNGFGRSSSNSAHKNLQQRNNTIDTSSAFIHPDRWSLRSGNDTPTTPAGNANGGRGGDVSSNGTPTSKSQSHISNSGSGDIELKDLYSDSSWIGLNDVQDRPVSVKTIANLFQGGPFVFVLFEKLSDILNDLYGIELWKNSDPKYMPNPRDAISKTMHLGLREFMDSHGQIRYAMYFPLIYHKSVSIFRNPSRSHFGTNKPTFSSILFMNIATLFLAPISDLDSDMVSEAYKFCYKKSLLPVLIEDTITKKKVMFHNTPDDRDKLWKAVSWWIKEAAEVFIRWSSMGEDVLHKKVADIINGADGVDSLFFKLKGLPMSRLIVRLPYMLKHTLPDSKLRVLNDLSAYVARRNNPSYTMSPNKSRSYGF